MKKLKSQWGKQMTKEALKMAMEALEGVLDDAPKVLEASITGGLYEVIQCRDAITAIKEALAQPEHEPVMILPDGSAFGVMSFPLPDDHWLCVPNEYRDGEYEPIDLPKPILTHELRDAVVAAVRYAVRGATMRGQETDFDPDALVQNAVYALCGPYTTPPQRKPLTDEEIMNIAKVSCIGISPHEDTLNFAKVIEAVHGIKE